MSDLIAILCIANLLCQALIIWLLCGDVEEKEDAPVVPLPQTPERQTVTKRCHCHRHYSHYEGDTDPGECHHCRIRKI